MTHDVARAVKRVTDRANQSPRVLWIAPILNHYKVRFLNQLSQSMDIRIVVLAGANVQSDGHQQTAVKPRFRIVRVPATKPTFGRSGDVHRAFRRLVKEERFDTVMLPIEKKLCPLMLVAFYYRTLRRFRLMSYNHPQMRSGGGSVQFWDRWISRFLFRAYDRVVFYTESSCQWALDEGMVTAEKASFANNTLDTNEIWSNYRFEINRREPKTILYVARLVRSKGVQNLLDHFDALSARMPQLRLIVIGDGPEAHLIKSATRKCSRITWCGAVVDEVRIAHYMRKSHVVFMPGASGLSIVHAFCYGKPYITLAEGRFAHGPEMSYLADGVNGLVLGGDVCQNVDRLTSLLTCDECYAAMCKAAMDSAKALSVDQWCQQMRHALTSPLLR